jgi:hypothetical protein
MDGPATIPLKLHGLTALLAPRRFQLKATIPTIDQNGQGLPHQFPTLSSRFGLDFPKTRIGMFVIPVFQGIKHLDSALQESCAPLGTGLYMNHRLASFCDD